MARRKISKQLDPVLAGIAKEAADEVGILTTQMEEAYYISMEIFMKEIRKGRAVQIPNFGNFYTSPLITHRRIERMFMSARKRILGTDPNGMTIEDVKWKLKNKYWPIYEQARRHAPRTGKRYRAAKKEEQVLRASGDTEQLQQFLERRKSECSPSLRVLLARQTNMESQSTDEG